MIEIQERVAEPTDEEVAGRFEDPKFTEGMQYLRSTLASGLDASWRVAAAVMVRGWRRRHGWGADPALGRALIGGLREAFRVVAFDYEGHLLQVPKPDTLTPANLAGDLRPVPPVPTGLATMATPGWRLPGCSWPSAATGLRRWRWAGSPHWRGRMRRCCRSPPATTSWPWPTRPRHPPPPGSHPMRQQGAGLVAGEGVVDAGADAPVRHAVPGAAGLRRPRRPGAVAVCSAVLCGRVGPDHYDQRWGGVRLAGTGS
jgi:hypothetical protein